MNAVTLASRAVLAQYASKAIRPFEYVVLGFFLLLVLSNVLLISYVSPWWWLLMVVVVAYGVVGSIAWLVIHFTIDRLRPEQTPTQEHAVKEFVVKMEKVADTLQMARFALLVRVIRDVMRRSKTNVLTEFANDSMSLKKDFDAVVNTFR